MKTTKLKTRLKEILESSDRTDLEKRVAKEIREKYIDEENTSYIEDLMRGGCVSGMVSHLISYSDTNQFYKDLEKDIEELIDKYREDFGCSSRAEFITSLNGAENATNIEEERNLLAWFAFEETARLLGEELGIYE